MKAERVAGLLLTVASATLLTACNDGADDRQGRGPSRSETREVGSFDSIDMSGAARLEITVGKPESLVIEGRSSSIERVETKVRHNTLVIESKPPDRLRRRRNAHPRRGRFAHPGGGSSRRAHRAHVRRGPWRFQPAHCR